MSISELYQNLNELRNTPVYDFIEPKVIADANDSVSQIIGILMDRNSYDIFIPLSSKAASLNIRDLLGIRNITSTKPTSTEK
jgi:hypothetical protein